jgi:cytochrome c556
MRMILGVAAIGLLAACNAQAPADNQAQPANIAIAESDTAATPEVAPIDAAAPLGTPVTGEEAKTVMHDRHEGMEHIGKATKTIGRELKSDAPNLKAIQDAAATIADLASKTGGWFRPGTGPDVGKTGAKPEIWQNAADVATKDRDFQKAAHAFNAAAASGDLTRIKDSFADLGKTCKACHDKYRAKMKH